MSVHRLVDLPITEIVHLIRPINRIDYDDATGEFVLTFEPDLSPAEVVVLDRIKAIARSHIPTITPSEWQALEPDIAEVRTFRNRTPAEWQAMTAAQRDNALIQWSQDITDILRALLRDQ